MNGNEIREKINSNNLLIHEKINKFIFDKEITNLIEENNKLRKLCNHQFNTDGFCIYCDANKEEIDE